MPCLGLIDCNNFFVSCERAFAPQLANRPVVVLSNNDGCVVSRSNEAKKLGIPMGVPLFKIQDLVKRERVAVFSGNMDLYRGISQRIMRIIADQVPAQEVYSIDECFVLMYVNMDLHAFGLELRTRILQEVGIPVSVGFSSTKTLAKAATYFAKHYDGYQGCAVIDSPAKREQALRHLPIEEVWGIGRRHRANLQAIGIDSAYAFTQLSERFVKQSMSITGVRTWKELQGIPCIPFNQPHRRQSVMATRSLALETNELPNLQKCIALFTAMCCRTLRKEHLQAREVAVLLRTNKFKPQLPQHQAALLRQLTPPTQDLITINQITQQLLQESFRPECRYKKVGVYLGKLVEESYDDSLFAPPSTYPRARLNGTIQALEARFGQGVVQMASQGQLDLDSLTNHQHRSDAQVHMMPNEAPLDDPPNHLLFSNG